MLKKFILLFLLVVAAVLLATAVRVLFLRWHDPQQTAWMTLRAKEAEAEGKPFVMKHTWVPLKRIPTNLQLAVLAAEDETFYQHNGFDWDALKSAYEHNETGAKRRRGGSTITQQLAKNLYLYPQRSYWRKLREAVITAFLELFLTKDRILELYLNSIEMGPGAFGVEEGAHYQFALHVWQLNLDQCCRLAAIIPAPRRYKVNGNYISRRAAVLNQIIGGTREDEDGRSPSVLESVPRKANPIE